MDTVARGRRGSVARTQLGCLSFLGGENHHVSCTAVEIKSVGFDGIHIMHARKFFFHCINAVKSRETVIYPVPLAGFEHFPAGFQKYGCRPESESLDREFDQPNGGTALPYIVVVRN